MVLSDDEIAPVCAPALRQRMKARAPFEDVSLLHDQSWAADWDIWSTATGIEIGTTRAGPQFSLYSLAVEEAKAGAGVLMGHLCLLRDILLSGELVRVGDQVCRTGRSMTLEMPGPRRRRFSPRCSA